MEIPVPKYGDSGSKKLVVSWPHQKGVTAYKLEWSEYGYLRYRWASLSFELEATQEGTTVKKIIKGLKPSACYVARLFLRQDDGLKITWKGPSSVSAYMYTLSEEQETLKQQTYNEHAIKAIKTATNISMKACLDALDRGEVFEPVKTRNHQLRQSQQLLSNAERQNETAAAELKRAIDAKYEQETRLQALQSELDDYKNANGDARKEDVMRQLQLHRQKVASHAQTVEVLQTQLASKQSELSEREREVARLMADCHTAMQQAMDKAEAAQQELRLRLSTATEELEQQKHTVRLLQVCALWSKMLQVTRPSSTKWMISKLYWVV